MATFFIAGGGVPTSNFVLNATATTSILNVVLVVWGGCALSETVIVKLVGTSNAEGLPDIKPVSKLIANPIVDKLTVPVIA